MTQPTPRGLTRSVFPPLASSQAVKAAADAEQAKVHGLCLGLTDAEIGEVVDAYVAHHRTRVSSFSWDEVRHALGLRASGLEWRP